MLRESETDSYSLAPSAAVRPSQGPRTRLALAAQKQPRPGEGSRPHKLLPPHLKAYSPRDEHSRNQ